MNPQDFEISRRKAIATILPIEVLIDHPISQHYTHRFLAKCKEKINIFEILGNHYRNAYNEMIMTRIVTVHEKFPLADSQEAQSFAFASILSEFLELDY